jgi:hypothetical protein
LQHASTDDLKATVVEAFSLGIHFPKLDADLYVPPLLEGVLGSKPWMAARLGATGVRTLVSPKPRPHARRVSAAVGNTEAPPPVGSNHRQSRRTGPDAPVARAQALVVARRCDVS